MKFTMQHSFFQGATLEEFDEKTAPLWLTSENTVPGSTMDERWFWNNYILTLNVGQSIETDFNTITRIE